ncbi:MAG TPA: cytidine deaminase [Bacteroidia bacterium]|jgi:cytidine deaminase|nr:cytidine deaminase [Bacteroidia bacterium]
MQKKEITITILEFENDTQLPTGDLNILKEAQQAGEFAYAPYSEFYVGAALRLANGKIIRANNQENVAYPSGLCAERVAVFFASANHPGETIESIAVSCSSEKTGSDKPFSPCGACRQVLAEYEQKQNAPIRIILGGKSGKILISESVKNLLPLVFEADELKK